MADYRSKRTAEEVEALLDIVAEGGSGGEKTTEAEIAAMGFTKNAGTITGITMNGASKGTSGVVDLGTIPTTAEVAGKYTKPSGGIPASDLAADVFLQGEKGDTGPQGPQGIQGEQGPKGEDGATFTPSVDADGNLSWTNDKGLTNPPAVNIKGPKGDKGDAAEGGAGEKEVIHTTAAIELLQPNKIYIYENGEGFEIQEIEEPEADYAEYHVILAKSSGGGIPSIVLPSYVMWANGVAPEMSNSNICELSIVYWRGFGDAGFNAVLTPFN